MALCCRGWPLVGRPPPRAAPAAQASRGGSHAELARSRRTASSLRLRCAASGEPEPAAEAGAALPPPASAASPSLLQAFQETLLRGSEAAVLAEAAALGLLTGGAVVLLNDGIHASHALAWGAFGLGGTGVDPGSRWPVVLLLPCGAGVVVSALRAAVGGDFDNPAGGSDGSDPPRESLLRAAARPLLKALAAVVTLGGGVPLGPEGPAVQLGSGVAAALHRLSPASEQRRLSLLAAGSAAGLSAGFGATLAGAFFAVEAVLQPSSAAGRPGDPPSLTASLVLLSAVLASVVSRAGLGTEPTFNVPEYDFSSLGELPLFLGLGAAAGGVSLAFTAAAAAATSGVKALTEPRSGFSIPPSLLPPLGGLAAGGIALAYPEILYNGFENVDAILAAPPGLYPPTLLMQILAAKVAATALARATGLVGGFYAPSLFMGAALGAAYGAAATQLPFAAALGVGSPAEYALLGMAAVLAAICRVPLTAVLLLFEYTQDFRMLLPLMATVGVASWVASVADGRAATKATELSAPSSSASAQPAVVASSEPASASTAVSSFFAPSADASAAAADDPALQALLGEESRLSTLLRELPVSSAMRLDFLAMRGDVSLLEAASTMCEREERVAVLSSHFDGTLLGLLTHDAAQRALAQSGSEAAGGASGDWKGGAAGLGSALNACARAGGSFTTRTAAGRVHPDSSLADALAALNASGLRQLAVVARPSEQGAGKPVVAMGVLEVEAVGDAAARELTQRAVAKQRRAAEARREQAAAKSG